MHDRKDTHMDDSKNTHMDNSKDTHMDDSKDSTITSPFPKEPAAQSSSCALRVDTEECALAAGNDRPNCSSPALPSTYASPRPPPPAPAAPAAGEGAPSKRLLARRTPVRASSQHRSHSASPISLPLVVGTALASTSNVASDMSERAGARSPRPADVIANEADTSSVTASNSESRPVARTKIASRRSRSSSRRSASASNPAAVSPPDSKGFPAIEASTTSAGRLRSVPRQESKKKLPGVAQSSPLPPPALETDTRLPHSSNSKNASTEALTAVPAPASPLAANSNKKRMSRSPVRKPAAPQPSPRQRSKGNLLAPSDKDDAPPTVAASPPLAPLVRSNSARRVDSQLESAGRLAAHTQAQRGVGPLVNVASAPPPPSPVSSDSLQQPSAELKMPFASGNDAAAASVTAIGAVAPSVHAPSSSSVSFTRATVVTGHGNVAALAAAYNLNASSSHTSRAPPVSTFAAKAPLPLAIAASSQLLLPLPVGGTSQMQGLVPLNNPRTDLYPAAGPALPIVNPFRQLQSREALSPPVVSPFARPSSPANVLPSSGNLPGLLSLPLYSPFTRSQVTSASGGQK